MMMLKEAAFDRSNGNHTSRIGLKVPVGSCSNIMVACVLIPALGQRTVSTRELQRQTNNGAATCGAEA